MICFRFRAAFRVMGRIPDSVPTFFLRQRKGLTVGERVPPGPDHAFDSACREIAFAEEVYPPAYIECAAKAQGCAFSSVFKFVH